MKRNCLQPASARRLVPTRDTVASAVSALLAANLLMVHSVASAETPAAPEAADSDQLAVQEIVVTATRLSVGSQHVPIALTAISGDELAQSGIASTSQLAQLAPSMDVQTTVSAGSPRFSLRGISNNDTLPAGSSAVATYVDDVYQASLFGITTSLFDLQRIEVLRGPQGTTFGKNTTGGAVSYFSQLPTNNSEGYVNVRGAAGDQPDSFLEGALNIPLIDQTLAMRISLHVDRANNYLKNLSTGRDVGGSDSQAGRVQLRWTPSAETAVNLTVFGTRLRSFAPPDRVEILAGNDFGFPPQPLQRGYVDLNPTSHLHDDFDNTGTTLRIEQALGGFSLTAISHYRHTPVEIAEDLDGSPLDLFNYESHSVAQQFGQEVRLASDPARRISGVSGVYFERDKVDDNTSENATDTDTAIFGKYNNLSRYITGTTTYAAFQNLTFKATDQLSFIAGVRKSYERKTLDANKAYFQFSNYDWTPDNIFFSGPPPVTPDQALAYHLSEKALPWTWDGTINYSPDATLLVFARVAKGFRSGGFNPAATIFPFTAAFSFPVSVPPPFQGESIRSYELGLKSSWLERKLQLNANVYHYEYGNQQVTTYPNGLVVTANAASSKVDGAELELVTTPLKRLELRASVAYTNARYERYVTDVGDFSGNALIDAPRWTANGSVNYTMPLTTHYELATDTTWSYRSTIYWDSQNSAEFRAGPMPVGNFRIGLQPASGKGFSIAAFINNVTNERPFESGYTFGTNYNVKFFGIGRLYGADLAYRW